MREVLLHRPLQGGNPHMNAVVEEIGRIASQNAKVFRTRTANEDGSKPHIFLTTHKDTHLRLGQMSNEAQHHLAELLLEEFSAGNCNELLIFDTEKKNGILATAYSGPEGTVIHVAPAN